MDEIKNEDGKKNKEEREKNTIRAKSIEEWKVKKLSGRKLASAGPKYWHPAESQVSYKHLHQSQSRAAGD